MTALLGAAAGLAVLTAGTLNAAPGAQKQQAAARAGARRVDTDRALYVSGELLVQLARGVNPEQFARENFVRVKRKLRFAPNTYVLDLNGADVYGARERVLRSRAVRKAAPNYYYHFNAVPEILPNDPLYVRDQDALRQINAETVWGIDIGERYVTGPVKEVKVALLDDGMDVDHPDLRDRVATDSSGFKGFDFVDNDDDVSDSGAGHGTKVASVIAAETNNGEGLASLAWEGVRILPVRVGDAVREGTPPTSAAFIDAMYYAIQEDVDVINIGFGRDPRAADPSGGLEQQAVVDAHGAGIVIVAPAGNSRAVPDPQFPNGRGVEFPAAYDEVIAVGAVGDANELAFYSDFGPELDLVAPGGNDSNDSNPSLQIPVANSTSTIFGDPEPYFFDQGTSLAAGFVSSAAAVLISQGAIDETAPLPQQANQIAGILKNTARRPAAGSNDDNRFGSGVLDAGAALQSATHWIDIFTPNQNEVTASFGEPLTGAIVHPVPGAVTEGEIQVTQTSPTTRGQPAATIDVTDQVEIVSPEGGLFVYEPSPRTKYGVGVNLLNVVAQSEIGQPARSLQGPAVPEWNIPARAFRIRVAPRTEQPGLKMWSIPFDLHEDASTEEFVAGGSLLRLARWIPEQNRYAFFEVGGSPQDPLASLTTTEAGVPRPPIGVGFWARFTGAPKQLQILGASERTGVYEIPLKPGWNLIGNPFQDPVPWNAVNVRFGGETMSIEEAARRNLMRNALWRYVDGRYIFRTPTTGQLVPWEGHWVRSFVDLVLVVQRVPTVQNGVRFGAAPAARTAGRKGDWTAAIRAKTSGRTVGEVRLGAARHASGGYGAEDVEMPPIGPGGVDLRIRHTDWGRRNGRYAQDLRKRSGKAERWTLELETSRPGTPVQLTWDRFPAGARALLQIEGERGTHRLTAGGSVRVVSDRSGMRRATVTVVPAMRS